MKNIWDFEYRRGDSIIREEILRINNSNYLFDKKDDIIDLINQVEKENKKRIQEKGKFCLDDFFDDAGLVFPDQRSDDQMLTVLMHLRHYDVIDEMSLEREKMIECDDEDDYAASLFMNRMLQVMFIQFLSEKYTNFPMQYVNYVLAQHDESESPKIGRNDPCPCGSGKKYKKCCLM